MTGIDPSGQADANPPQAPLSNPAPVGEPTAAGPAPSEPVGPDSAGATASEMARRRILIGSQRDPAAYRARRHRDWTPIADAEGTSEQDRSGEAEAGREGAEGSDAALAKSDRRRKRRSRGRHGPPEHGSRPPAEAAAVGPPSAAPAVAPRASAAPVAAATTRVAEVAAAPAAPPPSAVPAGIIAPPPPSPVTQPLGPPPPAVAPRRGPVEEASLPDKATLLAASSAMAQIVPAADRAGTPSPGEGVAPGGGQPVESPEEAAVPNRRQRLSADLEDEFAKALGGMSLDDLLDDGDAMSRQTVLEPESRHHGRVVAVRRDDVFIELGGREQGCIPVRAFPEPPKPGTVVEVIVQRFNPEEGLYDLTIPDAAVDVGDWDDIQRDMLVEVQVTGHNTGGLECDVNHIRGFIPISQIALYRVEDLSQFVGQRFTCLVTEANPSRRNLVLSRRAVLEREKEEARQKFFDSLAPGQVHQGVVRKLVDFGAFVDIGGADGLLHISQLSWGRINHPSEVLAEGQPIQVRIEKVDHATGRIGLSYRDMLENPWNTAAAKYPPNSIVRGKVVKLMEFGAFVELERGVEGLIHISELSHKRVWRTSDVVHEGDEIEVLVLSVNTEAQRISLSIKALSQPEPTKKEKEAAEPGEPASSPRKTSRPANQPLQGGLGKPAGGDRFGLKW